MTELNRVIQSRIQTTSLCKKYLNGVCSSVKKHTATETIPKQPVVKKEDIKTIEVAPKKNIKEPVPDKVPAPMSEEKNILYWKERFGIK